jgi:molybdate/tungstate transport system substrate-binding protein
MRRRIDFSSRRKLLKHGGTLVAGSLVAGSLGHLVAQGPAPLDVACAGSIRPMLEGPLKAAAAKTLNLALRSHPGGADFIARSLVDGTLAADVFISVMASPMFTVLHAGKAGLAYPIARTEYVLTYSPKSRFAAQFDLAAKGKANWWEILQQPGLRIARSDPANDPSGRAIIFMMMMAARKYGQPDLVAKVLGPALNPEQVLTGGNNQARLQSGELDVMGAYKIGPAATNQPYISLASDINLSSLSVRADNPEVKLVVADKTFYPEPLVFYTAALKGTASQKGAATFIDWLKGEEAQTLFRSNSFAAVGNAAAISPADPQRGSAGV